MNTFIISSKNPEIALDEAIKITQKGGVDRLDLTINQYEKIMGIEDVRNFQKNIYLKPFKGDKKALILTLLASATTDAQNAMLKTLEETPPNTIIILISDNVYNFLPTVLSRAKLIKLSADNAPKGKLYQKIISLQSTGEKLSLAQSVSKDKDEMLVQIEDAIHEAREDMLKELDNPKEALRIRKLIHGLEVVHYDLRNTNVTPRLTLENFLLSI